MPCTGHNTACAIKISQTLYLPSLSPYEPGPVNNQSETEMDPTPACWVIGY